MNITDKFVTVLLVIIASSIVVGGACALTYARSGEFRFTNNATEADIDSAEAVDATTAAAPITTPAPTEAPAEVPAATAEGANESAPADSAEFEKYAEETAESDIDEVVAVNTSSEVKEGDIDAILLTTDNLTDQEIQDLKDYLLSEGNMDGNIVKDFFEGEYGKYFNVYIGPDGKYYVPLNMESYSQTDIERPKKVVEMGLSETQLDDAYAFPFNWTDEQVKEILRIGGNQKANFTEQEIFEKKIELFQYWLGSPTGFEGFVKYRLEQTLADKVPVKDYWTLGNKFTQESNDARKDGKGMNIWVSTLTSKDGNNEAQYTNEEYMKYVIPVIIEMMGREAYVGVFTAKAGDHLHLVDKGFSSMRTMTWADYAETKAWLVFPFNTKNGKVAFNEGINCRDKRPGWLTKVVIQKPKKKVNPVPPVVTYQLPQLPVITGTVITTPSTPSTPSTPGTPDPTPVPSQEEIKSPKEEPKIPVGGGQKSDSGSGEKKEDQGNGKGEYKQGTSENPGNKDEQPTGPPSDSTDNGTAPTKPIEGHDSGNESGSAGGKGGGATGDNGEKITAPD